MGGFELSEIEVNMNDNEIKQFADALIAIEPDYPLTSSEIQKTVKTHGTDYLFNNNSSTLIETIKLINHLEKGGYNNE
jgi:hypothetical protein